jgi:hypothetical protein
MRASLGRARGASSTLLVQTLVVLALGGARGQAEAAAPLTPADVPAPLKPWVPWALHGHETERCPVVGKETSVCAWAGRLTLTLDAHGGRFAQDWQVDARTSVALPGDAEHWPLDVKANGKPVAVTDDDGVPKIELPAGRWAVAGGFQWWSVPESLPVPNDTGLVAVTLGGRRLEFPRRTDDGELFLQKEEAPAETDSLEISVHRKLMDGVPMFLQTRVSLEVAGKAREVTLGRALPEGFVAHALESELPARVEPDGRLRVQVRPGSFTLTLAARSATESGRPPARITRPAPDGPWKEGEEVWVFEASPSLRVVAVDGLASVDPQQTTLPDDWKKLPAYLLPPGATMALTEKERGDSVPPPDQLTLARRLWLDFDGGGLTAEDSLSGLFRSSWRLAMGPSERLGRVTVGGVDQFVTRLPDGGDGVEIRQGQASIVAESRIEGAPRAFPVAGWAHDFQAVGATLELPPGWRLLHATGADDVSDTWLREWSLLDLFLVLVSALAAAKLFGPRAGALTLVTLGLSVTEPDAPAWLWLVVLLAEALARALGPGKLGRVVRLFQLGVFIALVLAAAPFAVQQVRAGLYPAQERERAGGLELPVIGAAPEPEMERLQGFAAHETSAPAAPVPTGVGALVGSGSGGGEREAGILGNLLKHEEATLGKRKVSEQSIRGKEGLYGLKAAKTEVDKSAIRADAVRLRAVAASNVASIAPAQNLATYDPSVIVQTGPGLPRWQWRSVSLGWNGPVERGQRLSLWLLSPPVNAALAFLRVLLIAGLAWLLWRGPRAMFRSLVVGGGAVLALWLVLGAPATARAADFPPDEMLDHLREGLLAKPTCAPDCATLGRLALEASPERLRLRFDVSAAAATAVALPGNREHWVPADVLVDGRSGPQLWQDDDGTLWLSVAAGSHQIVLDGPLPARDVVQIPLPNKPHVISTSVRGWRLAGVGDDGEIADTLQLAREADAAAAPGRSHALAASSLPPFVFVERTLHLGLKWQVETRVSRVTPAGAAVLLGVPLLRGESPLGEALRISQGQVQVALGPDETETSWTSALEQRPAIELEAARSPSYAEVWRLDLGPIWHAERGGISPVHDESGGGGRVPEWRPWPGEKVRLVITRPGGTVGQSFTIESAAFAFAPGERSAEVTTTLELRASRGGERAVTLPEGATLEALAVDGAAQPLRQSGARVTLALRPGVQTAVLKYRDPAGLGVLYRPRLPDLGTPATNVRVEVQLPAERWLLAVGGPRLGPAVLFWSQLVVLLLIALALGRSTLTPLGPRHWLLLGLGLSQLPLPAASLVAGYLLVLGLRRRLAEGGGKWLFDLRQLALAVWTIVAVVVLFSAVREGLLSAPDMHVAGNGSQATLLRWFADRAGAALPAPWILSLPLLVYRVAMLVWALWLALAVIGWSRWAWLCFSAGGVWRPLRAPRIASEPE